jgi:hypothetical protein
MRPNAEAEGTGVGPAPAPASLLLSATSLWLLRTSSSLHWEAIFVRNTERISPAPLQTLLGLLDQLDVGYRLLALAALAFNVWALRRGKPRWLALAVLPLTAIALSTVFMLQ